VLINEILLPYGFVKAARGGGYCAFMIFMGFFAFIILLPMSGVG